MTALDFIRLGVVFAPRHIEGPPDRPDLPGLIKAEMAKRASMQSLGLRGYGRCERCGDDMEKHRAGWCWLCVKGAK
jgi:hypothetical protein